MKKKHGNEDLHNDKRGNRPSRKTENSENVFPKEIT